MVKEEGGREKEIEKGERGREREREREKERERERERDELLFQTTPTSWTN